MDQLSLSILDACPGALGLLSAERCLSHLNPRLAELCPALRAGMCWTEILAALGAEPTEQPAAGNRFRAGRDDALLGIQLSALGDGQSAMLLLSATPIAAQAQLRQGLQALVRDAGQGIIGRRLGHPVGSAVARQVADSVDQILGQLGGHLRAITAVVDALSNCDLRVSLDDGLQGELGHLRTRLNVTLANLAASIRQTIDSSRTIARTSAEIARQNQALAARTAAQAEAVQHTSANMEQLSTTVANAAANAELADRQGRATTALAGAGREAVGQVLEAMESINRSAGEVGEIIGVINDIAFQTNILALNAAVEAARAGEHGRGFAIVAAEVRALARRSAEAANRIRSLIDRSGETAARGKLLAQEADDRMREILAGAQTTSEQIAAISHATREQTLGIEDANGALRRIDELTRQNNELVAALAASSVELEREARYLTEAAGIFHLPEEPLSHPLHKAAAAAAVEAARRIGEVLEQAVEERRIDLESLFDFTYTEIPGTRPQKHGTPFDELTDLVFPALQEGVLGSNPAFVYAIAADLNGYVPTHNARFCQPLSGDYERDLVGNRTKRIYTDRVGQQVGRHTEPYKLQTYRRDTGELMFDMSAPIQVHGRHWGGFRIGYRIE
jgi:methyl-accepting chemotaxis protein